MPLKPGDTLQNGHYQIESQLGRGGFGFVYKARDTLLSEVVAIKELIPALVGDEVMLRRFLAEAKATMRLRHERIVATHNVFSADGNYYIVMEYMAAGSLETLLQEVGPLPVDQAVRIAVEVCEGLSRAHQQGIVHCDLKPANILLAVDGAAKVADFGIAHISGEALTRSWLTPAGFVAGTLPYMSPEQADGVRDDPRIDVYAVGAVLYRTLTGQTYLAFDPHETPRSQAENVGRIYNERPIPPSTHNGGIPAWLDGVVLKALAKRPDERYASTGVLRAALIQQLPAPAQAATPAAIPQPKTAAAQPAPDLTPNALAPAAPVPAPSAVPAAKKKAPLPSWFWLVVGAAGVLFVVLVVAVVMLLGEGSGTVAGRPGSPAPGPAAASAITTLNPTSFPTATEIPKALPKASLPAATFTHTPAPSIHTPAPPTKTPQPKPPVPGEAQTRAKDGMAMVWVPAGAFAMGSEGGGRGEQPVHTVDLDAFWIDQTEVTNAQFRLCVEAGACRAPLTCEAGFQPTYNDADKADHPVGCIEWSQARAYCQWAGARLPTEAEWEKAARGVDERSYPWGNAFDGSKLNFCDANCRYDFRDDDADDGYAQTAPVGSYPAGASPYGALDMAGNVWEWVADWYDSGYYARSPSDNPQGPDSGGYRPLRGGSWFNEQDKVRTTIRNDSNPTRVYMDFGIRCAVSPGG
jgi:formylglycine-generating enzyme required for sulfatase activity